MIETQAPKGYVPLSVSVKFKLNEDGTVTTYDAVTMKELSNEDKLNIKNEVTKIKVSKVDITNEFILKFIEDSESYINKIQI